MESQEHNDEGVTGDKCDLRNVPKHVVKEFIDVYRDHPALWQFKNKEVYGKRNLKYKGHKALVQIWKQYDPDSDIKMIKSKIQSIRGSFRKEFKKVHKSLKCGSGTEEVYKPKLWYFGMLQFLSDHEHELPTETVDSSAGASSHSAEKEDQQEEELRLIIATGLPSTSDGSVHVQQPRKKSKKLSEADETSKFLAACTNALQSSEKQVTENDAFGTFVTKKLEKVKDDYQRMFAEQLITKTLNYAIMGKLNEDVDVKQ